MGERMTDKIISLANRADNGIFTTPEQELEAELEDIRSGKRSANKLAVIFLDDTKEPHTIGWNMAKMNYCEFVYLVEAIKAAMFREP